MFWDTFLDLCNQVGKSPSAVAVEIGLTTGSPTGWKKGALPRPAVIKRLADYFGVSVNYLLTGRKDGEEDAVTLLQRLRDEERALLEVTRDMTPEQVRSMTEFARKMKGL